MTPSSRSIAGLVALCALAACGRPATVSDELQQDLQQASTAAVELAPRAPQTQVVSAIELGQSEAPKVAAPEPTPARKAPQRAKAPAQTRRTPVRQVAVERAPEPELQPVAEAPAVVAEAPAPQEEPAPITVSAPVPAPPSRAPAPSRVPARRGSGNGGWWSTGDVIRNAPFPINP